MSRPPVLDVLVAGCGNIAGGFDAARPQDAPPLTHAGAYTRHPGFRVAACADPDGARRAAFSARWNVALSSTTIAEAAAQGVRADVVSICTPTTCHGDDLAAALQLRPRAIFCEKPVTLTARETRYWVEACRAAGVLLAVNHTRRWAPDVARLRQQLAAGEWGAVRSFNGLYNKGVLNNGGHLVDLVQWLAGPLAVRAAAPAVHDFWPDDPTIGGLLNTAEGIPVTFATAHAADYAVFELQVVTQAGVVVMENGGMQWRLRRSVDNPDFRGYRSLGPAETVPGEYPLAMGAAVANLYEAVLHGAPLASTGDSALEAQEVCERLRGLALHPAAVPRT